MLVDKNLDRLRWVDQIHRGRIMTLASNRGAIERSVVEADLVIGAVLVAGGRAPVVVDEAMVRAMKPRAVIVDVAVDQGGCIETIRETSHDEPVYDLHGVIHYAVGNMPGAVPHTSTYALTNATLPYILDVAVDGAAGAARGDAGAGARCQHRRRSGHQRAGRRVPRRRRRRPGRRLRLNTAYSRRPLLCGAMRRLFAVVTVALVPIALFAHPAQASPTAPSERVCFDVSGAPGDVELVNLTPVEATAPGNGQLISSDVVTPPEASNVNFGPAPSTRTSQRPRSAPTVACASSTASTAAST